MTCDLCGEHTHVPHVTVDRKGRAEMVTCPTCRRVAAEAQRDQVAARLRLVTVDGRRV